MSIKEQAERLALEHKNLDPLTLKKAYWFPHETEILLLELEDCLPSSSSIDAFRSAASPQDNIDCPFTIALLKPEEFGMLPLPNGWGTWEDAVELDLSVRVPKEQLEGMSDEERYLYVLKIEAQREFDSLPREEILVFLKDVLNQTNRIFLAMTPFDHPLVKMCDKIITAYSSVLPKTTELTLVRNKEKALELNKEIKKIEKRIFDVTYRE